MCTRRSFLQCGSAALISMGHARSALVQELAGVPSLKDMARSRGLHFGSTSDGDFARQPEEHSRLFVKQCELLAPSWSWSRTNPVTEEGRAWEDPGLSFARQHRMRLTGGHLLWYLRSPKWLESLSKKDAYNAIAQHIDTLAERYGSSTYSWNVVNEALATRAEDGDFRPSVYQDKFGLEQFDIAAHAAREAAPHVLRVYNDYGTDYDTPASERKRRALLRLLDEFKRRETPIEAVGLQSHLRLGAAYPFREAIYANFLKEISDRGFKVLITELDIFDLETPSSSIPLRDQMVADLYTKFLNVALQNLAVTTVVVWGLSDRNTWLSPTYDPTYRRADGLPSRPLPFDADDKPKPAFTALYEALKHAPKRELA